MKKYIFSNRRRLILALILALISLVLCYSVCDSVKVGLIFAILFLVSGIITPQKGSVLEGLRKYWIVWLVMLCFCTLFLSQLIQNESVLSLQAQQIVLGFLCCFIPSVFLTFLTLRPNISWFIASGFLLLLSTINYYVFNYRGSELHPSDLFTVGTAINVLDRYRFFVPGNILYSWILFLFLCAGIRVLPRYIKRNKYVRAKLLGTNCALIIGFLIMSSNVRIEHFAHGGSFFNGFLLNFTLQIKETIVKKPRGYSKEKVRELGQQYERDTSQIVARNPDIIVIMDEAFSDLSILGRGLKTNISVTPFISSLQKKTSYGYSLTSVYGGGTPNSEYEFLTGNTLLFLNGIVYQQYLRKPSYSIVSELKSRGYRCIAMHPYLETGWRRNIVWRNLLFDECLFLQDFPQKKMIRGLVSDQEMFEVLLDTYRTKLNVSGAPVFLFGVTMQNHSDYEYDEPDFQNTVELQGYGRPYLEVEQYLSLIHETDQAVDYLLDELEKMDRDVVVVFYGDHQPALSDRFVQEVHGGPLDTLDEKQLLQMVPFFIWTNYDSESVNIGLTSLNYLSTYLFEKANMPLPQYNCFLKELETIIPAMNAHGYYSSTLGKFQDYSAAEGEEKEWLDNYWMIEYNSLFDLKNLDNGFFPLQKE